MKSSLKIIFLLFLVCNSCEYNLDEENFRDIEPPEDFHMFDLSITPSGDTLYLFDETLLKYNINTYGLDIINAELTLHETSWNLTYSPSGTITINTEDFPIGIDTLTIRLYSNSGTGSLADNLSSEGYYIEQQWIVVIDHRAAPVLVPTKSITKDGFLKITWPKCNQYNFVAYEVEASNYSRTIEKTIDNPDNNFYIDSLYVGGDFLFRVSCRVKNGFTWGESLRLNELPPELGIEEIGYESIKISWNKSPYNAQYHMHWHENDRYFNSTNDTSFVIPQPGLGKRMRFNLYVKSKLDTDWDEPSISYWINSFIDYNLGQLIVGANHPNFTYNPTSKILYSNYYDNLQAYNIEDYSVLNSVNIDGLIHQAMYSCPTNSTKIAAIRMDKIYIFDDNTFNNPVLLNYEVKDYYTYRIDHFKLTDNNFVAYSTTNNPYSGVGVYNLFDVNTRARVLTIDIDDYAIYSSWANVTTSKDAKYVCTTSPHGIKLYDIENGTANEIYSDDRAYRSSYFNPYNSTELFLSLKNNKEIEIRDPSNFELIKSIATPSIVVIQNIDPVTNYMLITDYSNLYIMNIENEEILLEIPGEEINWLFNNKIFTNTGYVLDVSADL